MALGPSDRSRATPVSCRGGRVREVHMVRSVFAVCMVFGMATLGAQSHEQSRLENCGVVMEEILNVEGNIPQDLLEKAQCVIVIPSMMTVAVGVGGNFGRGAMVCRSG